MCLFGLNIMAQNKSQLIRNYQFQNTSKDSSNYNIALSGSLKFAYGKTCKENEALSAINHTNGYGMGDIGSPNNYTFCGWIKATTLPNSPSNPLYITGVGGAAGDQTLYISTTGFGASCYYTKPGSASTFAVSVTGSTKPKIDTWFHVASVKLDDTLYIYVNGELENKQFLAQSAFSKYTSTASYLAARNGPASFRGYIDAYQIYSYGLSRNEIKNLYDQDKNNLCNTPEVGLIRDYRFTNNTADSTAAKLNLNLGGATPTYTNGRLCDTKGAMVYNASTGYSTAVAGENGTDIKNKSYAYCAWIKLNVRPNGTNVVGIYTVGNIKSEQLLGVSKNGFVVKSHFKVNDILDSATITGTTIPQPGFWYHVAGIKKNDSLLLYVNGILEGKKALPTPNTTYYGDITPKVLIGQSLRGKPEILNGAIDDIKIFDKSLNATEIKNLFSNNNGKTICAGPSPIGLVRDYRFSNNSLDSSSLGANLITSQITGNGRFCETNGAAYLPGTPKGLEAPFVAGNGSSLDLDNYTYATWVKIISRPSGNNVMGIISVGDSIANHGIVITSTNFVANANILTGSVKNEIKSISSTQPESNKWYHVVSIKKQDSLLLYVNGKLEGKAALPNSNLSDYGFIPKMLIGNKPNLLNGYVDDIKIFDKALSANDVNTLYNSNNGKTICQPQAPGLVRDYRFSNNLVDSSSSKSNLSITSSNYTQNRYCQSGKAIQINGSTNGSIPFKNSTHYSLDLNNYTYSTWIKINQRPDQLKYAPIITIGKKDTLQGIFISPNGFVVISNIGKEGSYLTQEIVSNTVPLAHQWYHITAVRKTDSLFLYVNGKNEGKISVPNGYVVQYSNNPDALLGYRQGYNAFYGVFDEVKIYDKSLTSTEVTALYTSGGTNICNVATQYLLRRYEFDGNLNDSSSFKTNIANQPSFYYLRDRFCKDGKAGAFGKSFGKISGKISTLSTSGESLDNDTYTFATWVRVHQEPLSDTTAIMTVGNHALFVNKNGFGAKAYVKNTLTKTNSKVIIKGTTIPQYNQWYHVVGIRKTDSLLLYVNGKLEAQSLISSPNTNFYGDQFDLQLGGENESDLLEGSLDKLLIYNYPISKSEIQSIYLDNDGQILCPVNNDSLIRNYTFSNSLNDSSVFERPLTSSTVVVYEDDQACVANGAVVNPTNAMTSYIDPELVSKNYTYSVWVKTTALPTFNVSNAILAIGSSGGDQTISLVNGQFRLSAYNAPSVVSVAVAQSFIELNKWYHIVAVKTDDSVQIYINNKLENSSKAALPTSYYGNNVRFGVGSRPAGGMGNFMGIIGDVKVFNKALSKDAITTLHDMTKPKPNCINGLGEDEYTQVEVSVYVNQNNEIELVSDSPIRNVRISNIMGQVEYHGSTKLVKTSQKGLLIISVDTPKGVSTHKILIR
jgi:hypothetical protein